MPFIRIQLTDGPFSPINDIVVEKEMSNSADIIHFDNEVYWQLEFEYSCDLFVLSGENEFGTYFSNQGHTYEVSLFGAPKAKRKVGSGDRMVSTRMSIESEKILNDIASRKGALWGTTPSWRTLLRLLATGEITC